MVLHKGARVEGADYFDDFGTRQNREGGGILSGLGQDDFESVQETIGGEGLQVKMNCRLCGKQHVVTLEWEELFVVGTNGPGVAPLIPTGWQYSENNGACYPAMINCAKCGEDGGLCPMVTPQEARDRVNEAVGRGAIPVGAIQMWKQRVSGFRGG